MADQKINWNGDEGQFLTRKDAAACTRDDQSRNERVSDKKQYGLRYQNIDRV